MRTVGVKLLADVAGYMSNIRRAGVATKEFSGELNKAAAGGKVEQITRATAVLGAGMVGVAAGAVKFAMDFDKSMSAVSAATHASAGDMAALRKAAIQAGQDTQFSATAAADGITELAKAGVATRDILGGGLKGALDLAAAGQLSVGEAAETAASAMTQFKLSGDQVPHIADLLAAGAGKAQGSVHDIGAALNQAGLVASQFGLTVEDTTGVLAEFAHAGLMGSDAGTSMKTMLLAMANPTSQTRDLMKELGISFYDARGQFIGMSGVAQTLQLRLRSLTVEQRNQALGQIFGNDAIRAASILYTDGAEGVKDWNKQVNDSGYATKTAAALTDNLAGDLERLKGSVETLAIQSGGGANDGLRNLAKGANAAVNAFSSLPGWVQQTVTVVSGLGGVSLLAAAGFLKMRGTAKDFMDQLRDMGPRGEMAATGIGKLAGVAGRLTLVGGVVLGVYEGFKAFSDWAEKRTAPVKANIDALTDSIKEFAATGKVTGELAAKYGDNLQKIGQDVDAVVKGMHDLKQAQADVAAGLSDPSVYANWNPVDPQSLQRIKDLDATLTNLVKNGGATQAKIMLDRLAGSGRLTADQFEFLKTQLPGYTAAAGAASNASTGLAEGFGDAAANSKTLTGTLDDAVKAGQKLTDVWTQLHGALLSTDKAQLAANQSIQAVKKSFQENGKAIEGNSDKALKNRIAVGDAAKAAVEAAQAKYAETGSVQKANGVYNDHIGQLRKTLTNLGLNKSEVNHLIEQYAKMPDDVLTKIDQPGMKQAITRAQDLWTKLQGVDGNWVARVSMENYADVKDKLLGLMASQISLRSDSTSISEARRELSHFMATGGPVYGPGGPTDDKVPAWLSAGEHVWTAAEVAAVGGQAAMMALRASVMAGKRVEIGDEAPGFARGGIVMPFRENLRGTKVPQPLYLAPGGAGGPGYRWMERAVHAAFPGMPVYSDVRPGAVTLTGNRSYHGMRDSHGHIGRAVDFAPSRPLAEWINLHFMRATRELITPWQSLNIRNGARHRYSALVENQHNFAGGNAHDHWAMARGGTITEPIFGVGASGNTYSFGENWQREKVIPESQFSSTGNGISLTIAFSGPVGSRYELENWLSSSIDNLKRKGKL